MQSEIFLAQFIHVFPTQRADAHEVYVRLSVHCPNARSARGTTACKSVLQFRDSWVGHKLMFHDVCTVRLVMYTKQYRLAELKHTFALSGSPCWPYIASPGAMYPNIQHNTVHLFQYAETEYDQPVLEGLHSRFIDNPSEWLHSRLINHFFQNFRSLGAIYSVYPL